MEINPIGIVKNEIEAPGHAGYRQMESIIILSELLPAAAFENLEIFSHLEIIFYLNLKGRNLGNMDKSMFSSLNQVEDTTRSCSSLFGTTIVKFIKKEENQIYVKGLDAWNGTPVIDIKPVMGEFMPGERAIQSNWGRKIT